MSAESSETMASLAAALLKHKDARVRSLAGSVLRQFEEDPGIPGRRLEGPAEAESTVNKQWWRGFWAGLWQQEHTSPAKEPKRKGLVRRLLGR